MFIKNFLCARHCSQLLTCIVWCTPHNSPVSNSHLMNEGTEPQSSEAILSRSQGLAVAETRVESWTQFWNHHPNHQPLFFLGSPWMGHRGKPTVIESCFVSLKKHSLHSLSCLRECRALRVNVIISQLDNLAGDWPGGHVQSHTPTEWQRWTLTSNLSMLKKKKKKS